MNFPSLLENHFQTYRNRKNSSYDKFPDQNLYQKKLKKNNCHNNNLRHQSTNNNAINNDNNFIIDDCNGIDEESDDSSNSIGFIAEWINAYIFITRKSLNFPLILFLLYIFYDSILLDHFILTCKKSL